MATGISFASVCIRKLERLKLLLTTQKSAFESDLHSEESHMQFLESINSKLQTVNAVKNFSIRNTVFSSKRFSSVVGNQFSTSQEQLPVPNPSVRDIMAKNRKNHHMSIGGLIDKPGNRIQGSVRLALKDKHDRQSPTSSFYGQRGMNHQYPIGIKDDILQGSLDTDIPYPSPLKIFQGIPKTTAGRSMLGKGGQDSGNPHLFSSLKKKKNSTNKKSLIEEGSKTERYQTTFHLETINESPIRHVSTMSNPSLHSIYATEPLGEGKSPKSPPSQITQFDVKSSSRPDTSSRLLKLITAKGAEKTDSKKSPKKYLAAIAGIAKP